MDTRTATEVELGIEVIRREKMVSYREVIALRKKDRIPEAIAHIQRLIHQGKVTGRVNVNMNQGGVTQVLTEQNGKVRIGSELDELTDQVFFLEKNIDSQKEMA